MFQGFSPQTIDFLWGIRMNNNREWFTEHKKQYVDTLYEPMKALGKELFQPFIDRPGNILKVSRIYRDARLHHALPYKESLWICIRQDVEWWAENPCLYFEINPDEVHYGFCWWQPKSATMEQFRKRISANPDAFLKIISDTEAVQPITVDAYKRPKEAPIPELAPFFAWKNHIWCVREEPISDALFTPALGQRVAEFFEKLIPLYEYCNQFKV